MENLLIQWENIQALKYLLNTKNLAGKIDLIYIDPPFATGSDFMIDDNRASTISKSKISNIAYSDRLKWKEFLNFLQERLIILKELLSENGSIYLHIDYKIGHYVKVLMDEIFGIENFRNDITRIKCNPKNFNRIWYGNIKDMILFYSKWSNPIWNEPREKYSQEDIRRLFPKIDSKNRNYTTVPLHAPWETINWEGNKPFHWILPPKWRHWRTSVEKLEELDKLWLIEWSSNGNPRKIIYADERDGKRVQDIWEFKDPQYPIYPTEKNNNILDLIIKTSSNESSIILESFCWSGKTLKSSQIHNRNWIGIDNSPHAINAVKEKITSLNTININYSYINLYDKYSIKDERLIKS